MIARLNTSENVTGTLLIQSGMFLAVPHHLHLPVFLNACVPSVKRLALRLALGRDMIQRPLRPPHEQHPRPFHTAAKLQWKKSPDMSVSGTGTLPARAGRNVTLLDRYARGLRFTNHRQSKRLSDRGRRALRTLQVLPRTLPGSPGPGWVAAH